MRRKLRRAFLDFFICPTLAVVLKRRLPDQKFIKQHAQTPDVHTAVVPLIVHHLGWKVVQSSTERFPAGSWSVDCPAEICDFQAILQPDKDVLWLDISVDNVLPMAIQNGLHHLLEVPSGASLRETASILEESVQLTTWRHFQHEVYPALIMEEVVQPQNVHVSTVRLNFDFPSQLVLHTVLDELNLVQDFQSKYEACTAISCDIHRSELSRAQALTYINLGQREPRQLFHQGHIIVVFLPIIFLILTQPGVLQGQGVGWGIFVLADSLRPGAFCRRRHRAKTKN
mmetsp:Transcript_7806/g.21406  ORF Transcript_7806/g.21406 Transcript_7806/m.21406 type:complete len:285 (-) Transcript_7806:15-869(-)